MQPEFIEAVAVGECLAAASLDIAGNGRVDGEGLAIMMCIEKGKRGPVSPGASLRSSVIKRATVGFLRYPISRPGR